MQTIPRTCNDCGREYEHDVESFAVRGHERATSFDGADWYGRDGQKWVKGTYALVVEPIFSVGFAGEFLCPSCFDSMLQRLGPRGINRRVSARCARIR